jgi:hypothetical protein
MSPSAQVYSVDLLRRLHAALARFGIDAQSALDSGAAEVRRAHAALDERLDYWRHQVNKRQEDVNRARADLSHARALAESRHTGCVEQELALRKALDRLREAEEKVVTVRRWQRDLPTIVKDLEGPARALSGFLDADLRQAVVLLENKIAALEAYIAIASPDEPASTAPVEPQVKEPS